MGMGQNPSTPGEHQNSWDLWMFIPLKMVLIGIDPYPHVETTIFLPLKYTSTTFGTLRLFSGCFSRCL
jgi:hypothetical protein